MFQSIETLYCCGSLDQKFTSTCLVLIIKYEFKCMIFSSVLLDAIPNFVCPLIHPSLRWLVVWLVGWSVSRLVPWTLFWCFWAFWAHCSRPNTLATITFTAADHGPWVTGKLPYWKLYKLLLKEKDRSKTKGSKKPIKPRSKSRLWYFDGNQRFRQCKYNTNCWWFCGCIKYNWFFFFIKIVPYHVLILKSCYL